MDASGRLLRTLRVQAGWNETLRKQEFPMRKISLSTAAAILLLGSVSSGIAQDRDRSPGMSGETPGHEMQEHGSVKGFPGASGYAPGHNRDADDINRNRATTGAGDRDDRTFRRDRDDLKMKRDRDDMTRDRD
jgi:hypothetical protein